MEMPLKLLSYHCGRCNDLQEKVGHPSRSITAEECGTLKATSNNFPGFGNIHILRLWLIFRISQETITLKFLVREMDASSRDRTSTEGITFSQRISSVILKFVYLRISGFNVIKDAYL